MANRGIIFDLDGTLLNTLEDITAAVNRGITRFGFPPIDLQRCRRIVGEGIAVLVRRALPPDVTEERLAEITAAVEREYRAGIVDRTRPYPGVPEILDRLQAAGVPMAILSNKPHGLTVESVRLLLPRWRFLAVYGARPDRPPKPDPTVPLEIAASMRLAPAAIMFVGDSEIDISTARHALMIAVAACWGFRDRRELAALGPAFLIDTPGGLAEIVFGQTPSGANF